MEHKKTPGAGDTEGSWLLSARRSESAIQHTKSPTERQSEHQTAELMCTQESLRCVVIGRMAALLFAGGRLNDLLPTGLSMIIVVNYAIEAYRRDGDNE